MRFFVISLLSATIGHAQPAINEQLEMMSIAYRLSQENPAEAHNPFYSKATTEHFGKYRAHEFVKYMRHLGDSLNNSEVDIGTWEIPSVAVHIGKVTPGSKSDDGWDDRSLLTDKMVSLYHKFYNDSHAKVFFEKQEPYYRMVIAKYAEQNIIPDSKWLRDFTGLNPTEEYFPILALQSSAGAYMRVNFSAPKRNTYSVFTCEFDSDGVPQGLDNTGIPRLMIHEMAHQYVNQLVDNHKTELKKHAERLLSKPEVWSKVKDTFYNNWEYLLYESIVRACSIEYIVDNKLFDTDPDKEIDTQEKAGFYWMKDLVVQLDNYQSSRAEFTNLEEFMPYITAVFQKH